MRRFLGLLLCALLLAGCAAPEEPYIPTGNMLVDPDTTEPVEDVVTEQIMRLAYYPDRSLDPYRCTDYTNRMLFPLIYQSLFVVDSRYQARPVLCASYQRSRDMKTYTFYLAAATFSDGSKLTAADVAASLRAAVASGYYSGRFGFVEQIATTDDGGVTVTLTTPYENFPLLLDVPILRADQVGTERPLGTGPYYYEVTQEQLRLRRRSDPWCVVQLPVTAQHIVLLEATDPSQLRDDFEFSDLSMVCADPGNERYVDFHSDYELWECENGIFLYLSCNMESPVLSDPAIRSAISYALDRDALVEQYYRGFARSTVLPASPQSPWYGSGLAGKVGYDPQRLTAAVAAAGLERTAVVLLVNKDDGVRLRAARAIADSLKECGLEVTVDARTTAGYQEALTAGEFDLYLGQTKLSANMDLSAFFAPEGTLSYGGISDPMIYALCLEALANSGNYHTLHQSILESGVITPVLVRSYAIFTQRGTFTELYPARDTIFYYDLGKSLEDVRTDAE